MMKWKSLTTSEKTMIVLFLVLVLIIIFRREPFLEGIKKVIKPYTIEQPAIN